jgi:hypothetical protein
MLAPEMTVFPFHATLAVLRLTEVLVSGSSRTTPASPRSHPSPFGPEKLGRKVLFNPSILCYT